MSTIRQRLHRKNDAGIYDTIHLETSSECVVRPDGTRLEDSMITLEPAKSTAIGSYVESCLKYNRVLEVIPENITITLFTTNTGGYITQGNFSSEYGIV